MTKGRDSHDQSTLDKLIDILDRRTTIPALRSLADAVKGGAEAPNIATAAIVLDANVFLRIPGHKKSPDIIDYLTGIHKKPIVVPGQAVQEFWNNQLNAAETIYKTIAKKHTELIREIEKFEASGVSGITGTDSVAEAVQSFKDNNEHAFDPELIKNTSSFLEKLTEKAIVPFAPRAKFESMILNRKLAKTPPGFKDTGSGDFLVWVDMLIGLSEAQKDGQRFDSVILLSHDKKIDWCRGEAAHPLLSAELEAMLGTRFFIWNLDRFATAILEANV